MTKLEIFLFQLSFGGYPSDPKDQALLKNTPIYKNVEQEFKDGKHQELWEYEKTKNAKETKKEILAKESTSL